MHVLDCSRDCQPQPLVVLRSIISSGIVCIALISMSLIILSDPGLVYVALNSGHGHELVVV
jgi:hypothetical protein